MVNRNQQTRFWMFAVMTLLAVGATYVGVVVWKGTLRFGLQDAANAFDIAPFALPGTSANEVRFEEPREIRKVVVTFKSAVPDGLGLSYLHKTWREERQDLQDPRQNIFDRGWVKIDDWFGVTWSKGAAQVEKTGPRTAVLRFDELSREGLPFIGADVDYRFTLGVRVDGVTPEAVDHVAVHTTSRPRLTQIRVTLDAGAVTPGDTLGLETYNCSVVGMTAESGTKSLEDGRIRLLPGVGTQRSFLAEIRHLIPVHALDHDAGLVTLRLSESDCFTISLGALLTQGPVWYAPGGIFVTVADDSTSFADYQREHQRRAAFTPSINSNRKSSRLDGSIAAMVARLPEQGLGGIRQGQPERQPVAMMLGCKYNRNRFRIETYGDIAMENGYGSNDANRFFFGMSRWSRMANYTDPAPALIYHVQRRDGALRVDQESFAVPLLKAVNAQLDADEPTVCMVRFAFKNEGTTPAAAALPITFSYHARHDRNIYQDGERSADPTALRAPLASSTYPDDAGNETAEQLLVATLDGTAQVRGAIKTKMVMTTEGNAIVLRQTLSPGESCQAELKVLRKPITTAQEQVSLARLDYDALRVQTAQFWNEQVAPWAELKTPEPDLNAIHKAHLVHVMISDHRLPGEEGLITTSVGTDAYGNFSNESSMILQELGERGLHDEVRKRLALWLKYQGTAKLMGRFSDQSGVFYGAGGSEQGESYVQHHGWIMWALAEHYFMTRDKAWLEGAAAQLIRGADWVTQQRRLTMDARPTRGWERGLLPAGGLEDVDDFYYWTSSNIWIWRGMDHTAAALEAIGHPEAERIRTEADQYKADILRSLTIARQHNPLVRLRDGRWVPHYPTHIYRRGRDMGWIRETLEGSVNLLLAGILNPNGPEATWILDDYQDNLYIGGEFGYPIPEFHETWYDWAGFSCQPNLLAGLMPYLDRDEIEVYLWMFFNAFNATWTHNIQGMVEHPRPVLGFSNAEPFKTSDESNSVKWLRYMFVYGKNDTLYIGKALPREWLSSGRNIYLKRIHTRFGVVSAEYQTDADENRITCKTDLTEMAAPGHFLVRFRHPTKKPIQSVRVNGQTHTAFDPVKGDVDVTGQSGSLQIEAFFGETMEQKH